MKRIAIVGAGLSGLTAAWQLTRPGPGSLAVTLFESSGRTGGIVQTVRKDGFIVELGPDSWVTEKSAARELVRELGLEDELLSSNDSTRKTHLLLDGELQPLPDGLRMMVPAGRAALANIDASPLFSPAARLAFRQEVLRGAELRRSAPTDDESIASFTERHFGREVLDRIAAPLLSGVFGGEVNSLSVRAVMAPFVAMEREHGSLIAALDERERERQTTGQPLQPIFTTLGSGLGTLTDALTAQLPPDTLRLHTRVHTLRRADPRHHAGWLVRSEPTPKSPRQPTHEEPFDEVILATPGHTTAEFLHPFDPRAARLLPTDASSAVLVALAWPDPALSPNDAAGTGHASLTLPQGFGFLVPQPASGEPASTQLLAATFVDQKFSHRAPAGGRLIRAFFGGEHARRLLAANTPDEALIQLALDELRAILGPLPFRSPLACVSRWPLSLPQYAVGHLERLADLDRRLSVIPGLHLLGNALHGVGLPDLIRQARALATSLGSEAFLRTGL